MGDDGQQVQTVLLADNSWTNYYMYRGLTVATRLFLQWEGLEPDNLAMTSGYVIISLSSDVGRCGWVVRFPTRIGFKGR